MNFAHHVAMTPTRSELAELSAFLAIAKHRSFRRAGLELGVTASAMSHALKTLEGRTGVRLVNRTNRSVTLTAAGSALEESIDGPLSDIRDALAKLELFRGLPAGKIRINTVIDAASLILGPVLAELSRRHPEVEVDLACSNRLVDIVRDGFDAGIRYGGTVPKDMIVQRLSPDLRWVVVGAPEYISQYGVPTHPGQLENHRCLGVRLGDSRIYRWEFTGPEGEFDIPIKSAIVADDSRATLAMALAGAGLTYGIEQTFSPYLASGALRLLLDDWASTGGGLHIYYPSRRQVHAGIRALVEIAREIKPLG